MSLRAENTHHNFEVHVGPYWRPGVASSGVLPTIQHEALGVPVCLTKTPVNPILFAKPSGGLLLRPIANLLNGRTESGRLARPLYPGDSTAVRRHVRKEHRYSTQGLVYPLIGRIGALLALRPRRPSSGPDPIGISCWSPGIHHVRRLVKDGAVYNEGFVFGGDDGGDFYGALRLEWTLFQLGPSCCCRPSSR